jgi:hypothetical protein
MRVVEDAAGRRLLLVKRSAGSSLVRDPETGEERFVPTEELTVRDGVDPLVTAAAAVEPSVRDRLGVGHDERSLGLLVTLARAPRSARALLEATTLCESDLLGLVTELRAAGLVEETSVDGERGYDVTAAARRVLGVPQSDGASVD